MARGAMRMLEGSRMTDRYTDSHMRSLPDVGGPNPTDERTDVTDVETSYLRDNTHESNARESARIS
jgi:hypothetical protein